MGDKHVWTNEQLKCFLETCIEEVNNVGRKGMSLHKDTWSKLGKVLLDNYGVVLTQRQLKNHYDNLKAKYTGFAYLKNKTGNLYNPQTNTFTLSTEEWEAFKKGHVKAASLKTTPLLFPDLCEILFDGSSATGDLRWATSQTPSGHGSSSCHVQTLQLTDTPSVTIDDDDDGTSHHSSEHIPEPPPSAAAPNVGNSNKRAKTSTPRARAPTASPDSPSDASPKASVTTDKLALDFQKALQHLMNGPVEHTVPQCLEKLESLELGPTEPLRFAAYHIFGGSLNMIFTFVVAGWEGVAHDSRILSEALADPHAPFTFPPPDKYYLCDAAYAHTRGFMAPYRNVRYWLGDFRQRRAVTHKEKFNHAHAKLRNIIERAFGVLKMRFPILKRMAPFPLVIQRNIAISCFALHNFIRKEGLSDEYFARYDNVSQNNNVTDDYDEDQVPTHGTAADREYMNQLRDEIAHQLNQNMF